MSNLHDILQTYVSNGSVPGAVGLVARGGQVEVQAVGAADVDGTRPMARLDLPHRLDHQAHHSRGGNDAAKTADALDDPVALAARTMSPAVVRTPASPVDDVVPAVRPITVADHLPRWATSSHFCQRSGCSAS
jgi:hypothetical protein